MTALILSAAFKGTVVLTAALLATLVLRKRSADLRHRIWLAAICAVPLLMIPIRMPQAATIETNYVFTADAVAATTSSIDVGPTLWAIGFALLMLRLIVGIAQLYRLTSRAQRIDGILLSPELATPLTWGREIVLPAYARDWSHEKLEIAITHERAHISRMDWFTQSFAQILTAIFWFHPLMWLASSRLRQEAEQAVDDAVLTSGTGAVSYAEQLLEVARQLERPRASDRRSNGPPSGADRAYFGDPRFNPRADPVHVAHKVHDCSGRGLHAANPRRIPAQGPGAGGSRSRSGLHDPHTHSIPRAHRHTDSSSNTCPGRAPVPTPVAVPTPAPAPTRAYVPTPENAVGAYPIGNGVSRSGLCLQSRAGLFRGSSGGKTKRRSVAYISRR